MVFQCLCIPLPQRKAEHLLSRKINAHDFSMLYFSVAVAFLNNGTLYRKSHSLKSFLEMELLILSIRVFNLARV